MCDECTRIDRIKRADLYNPYCACGRHRINLRNEDDRCYECKIERGDYARARTYRKKDGYCTYCGSALAAAHRGRLCEACRTRSRLRQRAWRQRRSGQPAGRKAVGSLGPFGPFGVALVAVLLVVVWGSSCADAVERSDTFNRADNGATMGTPSDGGSAWYEAPADWGIVSNQSYTFIEVGNAIAILEASITNVQVQVTLSGTQGGAGIVFRAVDENDFMMATISSAGGSIYKVVGGTFTSLGSNTWTAVAGDVWKVTVDSSNNITLYQNGVSRIALNDATHATNTKHGLRSDNTTALRFDDFSICPFAGCAGGSIDFYGKRIGGGQ